MLPIDLLRQSSLFAGLPDDLLEAIGQTLGKRTYAKGMVLFHKGSPGQRLYLIESGQVRIFVLSDSGQEITLNVHGSGECFGELALLDGGSRSASAVAVEKLVTYTLDREDFLDLLETYPKLARHTLALVSGRVRHLTALFETLAFLDLHGRVASCLLDLSEHHGQTTAEGTVLQLRLTQAELASCVAATRESVNKVLGDFRDEGFIRQDGHVLTILNPARLKEKIRY